MSGCPAADFGQPRCFLLYDDGINGELTATQIISQRWSRSKSTRMHCILNQSSPSRRVESVPTGINQPFDTELAKLAGALQNCC